MNGELDGTPLEQMTMEQFVAWAMRHVLDGFVTHGMTGVKRSLYVILPTYLDFNKAVTNRKNKNAG